MKLQPQWKESMGNSQRRPQYHSKILLQHERHICYIAVISKMHYLKGGFHQLNGVSFECANIPSIKSPKSMAKLLVFNTKFNPHFAGKYVKHALLKHWNFIDNKVKFIIIYPKPPMIAFSWSENLHDQTPNSGGRWLHVWWSWQEWWRSYNLTYPANTSGSGTSCSLILRK